MLFLSPALTAWFLGIATVLGLTLGSFLNCAAWRLAHGEKISKGRSHCAVCGHTLSALDLVPVFSWLALKGRCRYCGERISPRYPLTELLCAGLYVSLLLRFDVSFRALEYGVLLSLLLCASLVDLEDGWIPDRLLIAGAVLYFPLELLAGGLRWQSLVSGLFGAAVLLLPMLGLVLLADKLMGMETMGGGDLKLIALLGLYFGWQNGLFLLILSCFLGLGISFAMGRLKAKTAFPFGPALSLAAWLTALFGSTVVNWYLGLF